MTKISQLSQDTTPTLDDYTVTVDLATGASKRVTLSALMALFFANFDWSLNMKSATNTSSPTLTNADQDLANTGLTLSFSVASACKAYVVVSLGIAATADFEYRPEIRVDGAVIIKDLQSAAVGNVNSRSTTRIANGVVSLSAGTHTISGGVELISGTGYSLTVGGAMISALVLGKVTA